MWRLSPHRPSEVTGREQLAVARSQSGFVTRHGASYLVAGSHIVLPGLVPVDTEVNTIVTTWRLVVTPTEAISK